MNLPVNLQGKALKKIALIAAALLFAAAAFWIAYRLTNAWTPAPDEKPLMTSADQEAALRSLIAALNSGDEERARALIVEEVPFRIPANEFGRKIAESLRLVSIAGPGFDGSPVREVEIETLDTAKIMARAMIEYDQIFNKTTERITDSEADADLAKIYHALLSLEPLPKETSFLLVTFALENGPDSDEAAVKVVYNQSIADAFSGNLEENARRISP